jgi:hypothetical protein
VKGTKLWQAPGSPLISGQSRQHKPFVQPWIGSVVLAELLLVGALIAVSAASAGGRVDFTQSSGALLANALVGLVGTTSGAAVGVYLARIIGWRRQTVAGTFFCLLGGALVVWAFARLG